MTAIAFSLEFFVGGREDPGLRRLSVAFERAGAEVANLGKHVYPRLVPALESAIAKNFDNEGGPSGSWSSLSPKYAAWKAKRFPGAPILQRTRNMFAALTDSSSPHALRNVSGTEFEFGTKGLDYPSFHQTGTRRMPARPAIDLGADFEAEMVKAAQLGIRDAVRKGSEGLLDFEGDTYDDNGTTRQVFRGSRSGSFFINAAGGRTYLKRTSSGQTVKRTYGGRK